MLGMTPVFEVGNEGRSARPESVRPDPERCLDHLGFVVLHVLADDQIVETGGMDIVDQQRRDMVVTRKERAA